ncbi:MAG: hypothetical protein OXI56_10425, partial [bacterium]|nr:hypothetical protein [bacterium]
LGLVGAHTTLSEAIGGVGGGGGRPPPRRVGGGGGGGAAAAAMVALEDRELWCSARRAEAVSALAERVDVRFRPLEWGESLPGGVVVNATPLGMRGGELPVRLLERSEGLFDMAYLAGGEATGAVRWMRERRTPASDGLEMLAAQAEASFEMWTGYGAPAGLMERVARSGAAGAG